MEGKADTTEWGQDTLVLGKEDVHISSGLDAYFEYYRNTRETTALRRCQSQACKIFWRFPILLYSENGRENRNT